MTQLAVDNAIDRAPSMWARCRFKAVSIRSELRRGSRDLDLLSLESIGRLSRRADGPDRQQPAEGSIPRYLVVEPGDVVVNPMWLTGGSIAVSDKVGAVSPDYRVFNLATTVVPRFLHHVLRSAAYMDQYALFVRANTTFDRRIQQGDIDNLKLALPSLWQQRRIADFLDDQVSRVDNIIAARREQASSIRLLSRIREAELVHGKTASGRSTPWRHGPLRRFVDTLDAQRLPLSSEERGHRPGPFPYYGASGVIDWIDDFIFDEPLVLVSEDGANLLARSTPISFVAEGEYWVNNHAHILSPRDGSVHFWSSRIEVEDLSALVTGSAQPKLTMDALLRLRVSVPDDANICKQIEDEIATIHAQRKQCEVALNRSIEFLTEYKQSLITAAVTGKFDVTTASGRSVPG